MSTSPDFIVIGAGVVGAALAYGLLRRGQSVIVVDGAESDARASATNFGLVWVQGKGPGVPAYQSLTRWSSDQWPVFAEELADLATTAYDRKVLPLAYERQGGLTFTFGDDGFEARARALQRLHNESGGLSNDHEMIGRDALREFMPGFELGDEVSGASYCWRDGCVNPLALHTALLRAIARLGGKIRLGWKVAKVARTGGAWRLESSEGSLSAAHVVLAAGLGSTALAEQFGLNVAVRPQRGQVLVSQRCPRVMPLPANDMRQTADGTFLLGSTKEDVGFDRSTTIKAASNLARNALRITPVARHLNVVRHWAGLRVMTPDGAPIYDFAENATAVSCHSGITLAAVHANLIVSRLLDREGHADIAALSPSRFAASYTSRGRRG